MFETRAHVPSSRLQLASPVSLQCSGILSLFNSHQNTRASERPCKAASVFCWPTGVEECLTVCKTCYSNFTHALATICVTDGCGR